MNNRTNNHKPPLYDIETISRIASVEISVIREYIKTRQLEVLPREYLPTRTSQMVFDFFLPDQKAFPHTQRKEEQDESMDFQTKEGVNVSISREDVFKFLSRIPNESVDLIVTDPAYSGMNQMLKLGRGKIIGQYSEKGDGQKRFDEFHDTKENYERFLGECRRILKANRHIYIMFDSYSLLSLAPTVRNIFDVKNVIVWDKLNIGLGHYFRRRHEFIVFASKGKKRLNSRNFPDVWRIKRITSAKYPTQKPVELFEMMIAASAEPGYTVLDPFLGSGSSAIASLKRGCNFIGCDVASSSIKISSERIKQFIELKKDILQAENKIEDIPTKKALLNGKS